MVAEYHPADDDAGDAAYERLLARQHAEVYQVLAEERRRSSVATYVLLKSLGLAEYHIPFRG